MFTANFGRSSSDFSRFFLKQKKIYFANVSQSRIREIPHSGANVLGYAEYLSMLL